MSITAIANAIAGQLNDEQLGLAATAVSQLGDTLSTIAVQRTICAAKCAALPPQNAGTAANA